jgi:[protein-PII] uridylyltransferase
LAGASGIDISRRRTDIVDKAVIALFKPFVRSGVALAAVGGYGRREMTPGSDIDLLFVHEGLSEEQIRPVADAVLYPLWDVGIAVSHAVRTPSECSTQAAIHIESLTTVLDVRTLAGSQELIEAARAAVTEVATRDPKGFSRRLMEWREDRAGRFGHAGRMLEPDLKESLGGLRDVPIARWCLGAKGWDRWDARWDLESNRDLLLLVRTALHLATGSRSTLLLSDQHQSVADALGLVAEPGWENRDVLMRNLFGVARFIDFVATQALRRLDTPVKGLPVTLAASRFNAYWMAARALGNGNPTLLGRLLQGEGASFPFDWLLSTDLMPDPVQLLPGWSDVRCRPQRDPYHRFPVDVHLAETVGEAQRLLSEPDEPFAVQAVGLLDDPTTLLLGALLHDIGKVGKGSHVAEGVKIAAGVLGEMALPASVRDDVLFLVREHLLLSHTATRRNLEDEDLILRVAARIGDAKRLALLYLLTIADSLATGPSASTPWRMNLVRDLVSKVSHVFERGLMDPDRAGRLGSVTTAAKQVLADTGIPEEQIRLFLEEVPPGYLLWAEPSMAADHARLIVPGPGPAEVRVHVGSGRSRGTFDVAVGAVDRIGLLSMVAGSFTLSGLSILSAQAFTTSQGMALDVFEVRGAFEEDVDPARWRRFEATLGRALEGEVDLESAVRTLRAHYRPDAAAPIAVKIDQEASDFFTLIEVAAPDRMGLLFDLAKTLSEHGLDVHVAKVATYGPRVVDVFYVRDEEGQKVERSEQGQRLVEALTAAASS